MSLMVVTGGARSGKSAVAEQAVGRSSAPVTVTVFGRADDDPEMAERIARHQADRPDDWTLVEATDSVEWTERVGEGTLLVDCLGTLLAMVMGEVRAEETASAQVESSELPSGFEAEVERRFAALVGWLVKRDGDTVVVTNEVGDGIVPAYPSGRVFRDVLGRANRSLVTRAQVAYLVVAGRVLDLTQLPASARWPRR